MKPTIKTDHLWNSFEQAIEGHHSDWETFKQAYQLSQLPISQQNELKALQYLPNLTLLDHQEEAVKKVLHNMHGRAILADEVGLGKTIEAGVILKELMIKGLVRRALILVPPSLLSQWESELNQTFYIPARAKHRSYPWESYEIVIASIDLAKKEPHASSLQEQSFDCVIVDEAHRLKNPKTKNFKFVQQLQSTYCLLLTATPIQNSIDDVYYLMKIVRPGLLGDRRLFHKRVNHRHDEAIQSLIRQSMVRTRKRDIETQWGERHIDTMYVDFSSDEQGFYEKLASSETNHQLTALTYEREFCSSREALYVSLQKQDEQHAMLEEIGQLPHHAKALKAIELIQSLDEPVIIFTEYKSTQVYLQWLCQQNNIRAIPYNGDFKKSKKQWMLQLFQQHGDVLITTDAGTEGLNLQYCHHMIHYDLPWNPMRLEQRIGRIHRYGQTQDINIYYLILSNTIEEHIWEVLYEKLSAFEGLIGEIDHILSSYGLSNFEDEITTIYEESRSKAEADIKINNLMSVIEYEHLEEETKDETN
ncbi:DEAD/DEAH box helicase [Alkalibacillus salilacus]|uniref:SNF2 family DNA or RNA helicase n=1 Tax=Alkalibacillus salilacus TaxID=284582 RepID=A0ABT9VCE5_9BACI|nr:SNF2-related protein [Alkalibacillus salilacus]MDQ0158611.1 SNF2 family DNA or RNA helicase [Alkalibacillus salilacus]